MKHNWNYLRKEDNEITNPTGSSASRFYQCKRCQLVCMAESMEEAGEKEPICTGNVKETPVDRGAYYVDEIVGKWLIFHANHGKHVTYGKIDEVKKNKNSVIVQEKNKSQRTHVDREKAIGVYNRRNKKKYPIIWKKKPKREGDQ